MSIYREVRSLLELPSTMVSTINKLGKMLGKAEDSFLKSRLQECIRFLQATHATMASKSTPRVVLQTTSDSRVHDLYTYCKKAEQEAKPEWMVIALRHGWRPPES